MPDTQPTRRVTADDIPTGVTKLVYTCPASISVAYSQNQAAELLAHYWAAIEQQVLAAAVRRVGLLPTANDGTLIAASRERILHTIANPTQES